MRFARYKLRQRLGVRRCSGAFLVTGRRRNVTTWNSDVRARSKAMFARHGSGKIVVFIPARKRRSSAALQDLAEIEYRTEKSL